MNRSRVFDFIVNLYRWVRHATGLAQPGSTMYAPAEASSKALAPLLTLTPLQLEGQRRLAVSSTVSPIQDARGESRHRLKMFTASQVLKLPTLTWLIKGVLPSQGLAVLFGQYSAGKSFLALHLGHAVATGSVWFGKRVKQRAVLYLALEGASGMKNRLSAFYATYPDQLTDTFVCSFEPIDLLIDSDVKRVAEAARSLGEGTLVVIDTLSQAMLGGDENTSRDMGLVVRAGREISLKTGGLVLFVAHPGKDSSRGLRGHSNLPSACDSLLEVSREGGERRWKAGKQKDGADDESFDFSLEEVILGSDEDGDLITSCAVREGELRRCSSSGALPERLTANQRGVMAAVQELVDQATFVGGEVRVALKDIVARAVMTSSEGRKKDQAKRVLETLHKAGRLL